MLMPMTDDAAPAEDGEGYEDEPKERSAPGLAVTALAGATSAVAAYYAPGPDGAALFGAATPFFAVGFQWVVSAICGDKERRVDRMLQSAGEAARLTPGQLADRAGESEQTRFLTDKAIQAAANTIWPEGVRAIGRAYARSLLAEDKPTLDIRLRALGIMQDLDELHVRLLDLLVKFEPEVRHDGVVPVPQRAPSYFHPSGRADSPKVWSTGRRNWATWHINALMPDSEPVLSNLLGELRERGLIQELNTAPTTTPTLEPIWAPTELGETILGFYAEPGAEDGQG
jgi:hypothetical protein